jgi:hypothetical protein
MELQSAGKQEDGRYESSTQGFKLDYVGCVAYACADAQKIWLWMICVCRRYIFVKDIYVEHFTYLQVFFDIEQFTFFPTDIFLKIRES